MGVERRLSCPSEGIWRKDLTTRNSDIIMRIASCGRVERKEIIPGVWGTRKRRNAAAGTRLSRPAQGEQAAMT